MIMRYEINERVNVKTHFHPCWLIGTIIEYMQEGEQQFYKIELDFPIRGNTFVEVDPFSLRKREEKRSKKPKRKDPSKNPFRKIVNTYKVRNELVTSYDGSTIEVQSSNINVSMGDSSNYMEKILAAMTPEERKQFED